MSTARSFGIKAVERDPNDRRRGIGLRTRCRPELRTHLGQDRLDLLAHSAAGNLALQYAAAHPDRIGKLALDPPGTRAVGIESPEDNWHAALGRRSDAPWLPDALKAINAWAAGDTSSATQFAAMPFFYGRWDASAQAHAIGEAQEATPDAVAIYYADGALDPETTRAGLSQVAGEVLVLVGELDVVTRQSRGERWRRSSRRHGWPCSPAQGTSPG